jgi:DNA primase
VDRLLPTLRAAADPTLRDIYVKKVSDRTGVRRETLEAEMRRAPAAPAHPHPEPTPQSRASPLLPKMGAENNLLLLMIRNAEYVESAAEWLSPSDFDDPGHRAIFEALMENPELRSPPSRMDVVARQRLEELLAATFDTAGAREEFTAALNRLRAVALDRRMMEIHQRILAAATDDEKAPLVVEKQRLSRELRAIDPEYYWKATAQRRWTDSNSSQQDR